MRSKRGYCEGRPHVRQGNPPAIQFRRKDSPLIRKGPGFGRCGWAWGPGPVWDAGGGMPFSPPCGSPRMRTSPSVLKRLPFTVWVADLASDVGGFDFKGVLFAQGLVVALEMLPDSAPIQPSLWQESLVVEPVDGRPYGLERKSSWALRLHTDALQVNPLLPQGVARVAVPNRLPIAGERLKWWRGRDSNPSAISKLSH